MNSGQNSNTKGMVLGKFLELWHESLSRIVLRQEGHYGGGGAAWAVAPMRHACNSLAVSRKHAELWQGGDVVGG